MRQTALKHVLIAPFLLLPLSTFAQPPAASHATAAAQAHDTSLPVTRVSLYKNGVGYFEHTGHIFGDAAVTIDFTTAQLNDVLQSLTAIDLNGGRISGAEYNSTAPLEQQLKSLPLALGEDTTSSDFYAAIRGARVEVHTPGIFITGRILTVEDRAVPVKGGDDTQPGMTQHFITVVSDSGEVRTIELTPAASVRLLDADLHGSVNRYLQLLAGNRSQGLRHLTLQDRGSGSRELRVSYISEVPVWKSTYRILLTTSTDPAAKQTATLQGWAVVDNTVGSDWVNVQLSLIAGSPQSFIQPLSDPIYSRRPEIPIAQNVQLTPQTHESSIVDGNGRTGIRGTATDPSGAIVPNAQVTVTNAATGAQISTRTGEDGTFEAYVPEGTYTVRLDSPGFQSTTRQNIALHAGAVNVENFTLPVGAVSETVEISAANAAPLPVMGLATGGMIGRARGYASPKMAMPAPPPPPITNYEQVAGSSLTPQTQSSAFDDFFQYRVTEPVTIRKNESALVPILQDRVDADRVTLVTSNGSVITGQPLRALWITNTSGLTLDRGSFSIIENGNFGGEGLLDPIHPNERRLLSYAADQAVHVTVEGGNQSSHVVRVTAGKGVLQIFRGETKDLTYVVHNAASESRNVVIEQPVDRGLTLNTDSKPEETTATVYRWRVPVKAGETTRLHIGGAREGVAVYYLTQADDNQLTFILNSTSNNPELVQALQPVLAARRRVADAQVAVDQTDARLTQLKEEEGRQRSNITALNSADKGSRDRFVRDLNATEDQIKAAQAELATRTATLDAAKADLANRIEALQIDQKL